MMYNGVAKDVKDKKRSNFFREVKLNKPGQKGVE